MVLPVPVIPDLSATEVLETSDESLAKFRLARLIPQPRAAAEAAASASARARRSLDVSEGTKEYVYFKGESLTTGSIRSLGILPGPGFIKSLALNLQFDGGTGSGTWKFGVRIQNGEVAAGTIQFLDAWNQATKIWEPNTAENPDLEGFQMMFNSQPNTHIRRELAINFPVYAEPASLIARLLFSQVVAGTITAQLTASVIFDSQPAAVTAAIFVPPTGRLSISPYSAGATPRTASSTPRAAAISISQGGRILSERIVAWESLTPAIRADWFNRQVGGAADPNIRWIP